MKKIMLLAFVSSLVVSLFGSQAMADIVVNVHFSNQATYTGAAVVGNAGDVWNRMGNSGGTGVALVSPTGASTSVKITWMSQIWDGSGSGFLGGPYANLMRSYLATYSSGSLALSGLAPDTDYALYLYSQGDFAATGRKTGFTVNGLSDVTTAAQANASTFINDQNYLVMNVVSDSFGVLNIAYNTVTSEADLNGLQLVSVPEPATMSLLALGGIALIRRRSKK